eukprot:15440321-Alexandrium_andersonii.AAC.2
MRPRRGWGRLRCLWKAPREATGRSAALLRKATQRSARCSRRNTRANEALRAIREQPETYPKILYGRGGPPKSLATLLWVPARIKSEKGCLGARKRLLVRARSSSPGRP